MREPSHDLALPQYQRGGGTLKSASFRRLLSRTSPEIIFLQETMVDSQKVRTFLNKFCSNWHICSVKSPGTSGEFVVSWDNKKFDLTPYMCCGGILLTGTSRWSNQQINFLNIYGPCTNRKVFLDKVEARGLLDHTNLITTGDMNLKTNVGEVWGASAT